MLSSTAWFVMDRTLDLLRACLFVIIVVAFVLAGPAVWLDRNPFWNDFRDCFYAVFLSLGMAIGLPLQKRAMKLFAER